MNKIQWATGLRPRPLFPVSGCCPSLLVLFFSSSCPGCARKPCVLLHVMVCSCCPASSSCLLVCLLAAALLLPVSSASSFLPDVLSPRRLLVSSCCPWRLLFSCGYECNSDAAFDIILGFSHDVSYIYIFVVIIIIPSCLHMTCDLGKQKLLFSIMSFSLHAIPNTDVIRPLSPILANKRTLTLFGVYAGIICLD